MAESNSQGDPVTTQPQHETLEPTPDPSSPVSRPFRGRQTRKSIYIVLLGPSGAGKSLLSNTVCDEQALIATPGSGLCTTSFRHRSLVLEDHEVKLIDSPGFNDSSTNNSDVLSGLVRYLMRIYNEKHHRISGIVYLHPEGEDINCDHLKQNMGVLKALVGDRFLPQLKIAVVPNGHGQTVDTDLIRTLQGPGSPFHAVHAGGAEIVGLPLRAENIREFLLGYIQLPYLLLKIQNQITHGNVGPPREYITKLFERTSTTSLERSPRSRRGAARASNHPHDTNLAEAAERSQQLELALAESEAEIKLLRDQFQQIRSEYASLRSELQLNDNMEQGNIVQCLKDLNRCIGNLGRSIAEHIVDHYIPSYADDDTTLKASDLSRVKAQFHHQEGRPSLVVSSSGDGMPAEDFFDHGIRSIVCKRLYENIFLPFHPILLGDPRNDFMNELYQEVRYQDNQTAASKWRANSFLAVSKNNDSEVRTQHIRTHVENIKTQDFAGLFAGFFDEDTNVSLEGSHDEELERLVSLAWDWNHILKGSVVMLGDFQPTVYDNGVPFDPSCMADFEPKKGSKKVPQTALCTIGLGLKVSRSKVKGSAVDDTIICKASVVTEHIYE